MTTTARTPHHTTKLLAATFAAALALVAVGAGSAAAAPAASLHATSTCWQQVINDWLDNNQVDRIYAIPCYTQAIQHLSQYPDVAGYSSAEDDIHRALLAAIRLDRGGGGPTGPSGGPTGPPGPGSPSGGLALLLLLAAGGTWFARRLQARRVTSAPLTAPAGPKRR